MRLQFTIAGLALVSAIIVGGLIRYSNMKEVSKEGEVDFIQGGNIKAYIDSTVINGTVSNTVFKRLQSPRLVMPIKTYNQAQSDSIMKVHPIFPDSSLTSLHIHFTSSYKSLLRIDSAYYDTVWDYHIDSIYNIEWWMYEYSDGDLKLIRGDDTLIHTFFAPHIQQFYKHIRCSLWYTIKNGVKSDPIPLIMYKQHSSYTIHTL